ITVPTHKHFDNVMEGLDEFYKGVHSNKLTRKQEQTGKMSLIYESESEKPKAPRVKHKKAKVNNESGHGNVGKAEDGVLGGVSDFDLLCFLVDELIKSKLNESSFQLPATTGEGGLTNKRKADDAVSDIDMEDGEIKDAEDHDEKSDVKDGKPVGKKVKVDNPYLVKRPFAPSKNTKPRDPKRTAVLNGRIKFNKGRGISQRALVERKRLLYNIKDLVSRAIEGHQANADTERSHADLRKLIHKLEHCDWITEDLVELTNVKDEGLHPLTSNQGGVFPDDIVDDATAILTRWSRGELNGGILRGIHVQQSEQNNGGTVKKVKKVKKGVSYTIEKDYDHVVSARFGGANGLFNGQWWPFQVCAVRDGAHGERQAGIAGKKGRGAQSIILAGSGYKDIDNGDEIEYCGTSGAKGHPTEATKLMDEAWKLSTPVRVMRSSTLAKKNKYRPAEGIRYDGLYDVIDSETCDEGTAMYRFKLKRQENQGPIRFEGPAKRPTQEDLNALWSVLI
ncbi:MAG: hypothetical protein Q9183_006144, partial [Haloplaca sp. 2 TL-2023]